MYRSEQEDGASSHLHCEDGRASRAGEGQQHAEGLTAAKAAGWATAGRGASGPAAASAHQLLKNLWRVTLMVPFA